MRHHTLLQLLACLATLSVASQAIATPVKSYIYDYTGPLFAASDTDVARVDDPLRPGSYDDADRLTMGFTLNAPITINTVWTGSSIDIGKIESFFFNDGREGTGGVNTSSIDQFAFRTDGSGNILEWAVSFSTTLFFGVSPTFTPYYTDDRIYRSLSNSVDGVDVFAALPGCVDAETGICGTDTARHFSAPGVWTVTPVAAVPVPPALPLLGGGLVGLHWLRRRRRAQR